MNFRKNILLASVSLALLGLNACGVTTQDKGSGNGKTLSGLALDGIVAGARVYVDTNGNNEVDVWEPRAKTDSQGYFTFNPVTNVNYCNIEPVTPVDMPELTDPDYAVKITEYKKYLTTPTEELFPRDYCLKIPTGNSDLMLKVVNGEDKSTTLNFTGVLSAKVNLSTTDVNTPIVVSPISTLSAYLGTEKQTIFTAENLALEDDNKNFMDFTGATIFTDDAERMKLLSMALKLQYVTDMISGRLDLQFDQDSFDSTNGFFGSTAGVANNIASVVYERLAEKIKSSGSVSTVLESSSLMQEVVEEAWDDLTGLVAAYNQAKLEADSSSTDQYTNSTKNPTAAAAIANDAVSLASNIGTLFNNSSKPLTEIADDVSTTTVDEASSKRRDVSARMKAISIVSYFMRKEGYDQQVTNATTLLSDSAYLTNLRYKVTMNARNDSTTAPISLIGKFKAKPGTVVASDVKGGKSITDLLSEANSDPANSQGFTVTNTEGLSGNGLNISEDGNNLAIEFAENPDDPAATSGIVTIDTTFIDGFGSNDNTSGSQTNEATQLTGTWHQDEDGKIIMDLELAGGIVPVTVDTAIDENGNTVYVFDGLDQGGVFAP